MTARSSSSDSADQAEPHEGHVLDFQSSYRGEMTALALILLLLAIVICGLVGFAAYTARQVEIAARRADTFSNSTASASTISTGVRVRR